jgi:hypothetical protein
MDTYHALDTRFALYPQALDILRHGGTLDVFSDIVRITSKSGMLTRLVYHHDLERLQPMIRLVQSWNQHQVYILKG